MFNNVFKDKKIIVTGHTGFKGAWITIWLHHLGAHIVGISKDVPTNPSLFEELKLEERIEHHNTDICDLDNIKKIFQETKPDFVFHLAAQPIVSVSYQDPISTLQTNILGTANILEALRTLENRCNAIMITSDKCYDNVEWVWGYREKDALGGKDPYSASKGAAELIIKTYYHSYFKTSDSNIKLVSTRAGNVVGGGDWAVDRIVPDSIRAWSQEEKVKIRNPKSTRPWQHVLEPLSGYLRSAQILQENSDKIHGEPFNFGPNADQNYTVLELLEEISKYWEFKQREEKFSIEPNTAYHEAGLLKLNCDKALFYLQWKPTLPFEETARFTGEWYDTYYHKKTDNLFDYTVKQIDAYVAKAKQKNLTWAL
ncbi:MAG TPA: CDP-glucose 4,6-dehydratase [Candidatus Sulfotelmatobacter sp.]|nr:CDP-glucose 4,6-dehydratase [Candidatus Sulfotelmatobacter sp.]